MRQLFFILATLMVGSSMAAPTTDPAQKPRIVVLTDSEIDDRCSMAHLLLCSSDVDIAAMIQTNSCFQKHGWSSEHWLEAQLDHYAEVYDNLRVHDAGYPHPDTLRHRVYVGDEDINHLAKNFNARDQYPGQPSLIDPAEWAETPGSEALVRILRDDDPRKVFLQAWGGSNTLAKALQVLHDRYPADYHRACQKAILYNIWYQDPAGPYIEQYHPEVTMLLSFHFAGTWDYGSQNFTSDFVTRWLHRDHGQLAADYTQSYISEGDSPAFLYSLQNGLRSYEDPTYGGWGGQFFRVYGNVYRDTDRGSYMRWVEYANRDLQERCRWAVTPRYEDANHKPVITPVGPLDRQVKAGETVTLQVEVSDDNMIDLDLLWSHREGLSRQKGVTREQFEKNTLGAPQRLDQIWWQYYEAGTCRTHVDLRFMQKTPGTVTFTAPAVTEPETLHIVFQVTDMNKCGLTAFTRFILTVVP